jgi:hypothetical protein
MPPLKGRLLALLTKNRVCWKGLQGANTLNLLLGASMTKKKIVTKATHKIKRLSKTRTNNQPKQTKISFNVISHLFSIT